MAIEHHSDKDTITLADKEQELIMNEIEGLNTIMGLAFGNMEAFDRYGGHIGILSGTGVPTGIELIHGIYGEPQFNNTTGDVEFETVNRIIINNEFVTILLTPENTISEVQTNINITHPYHIYQWLNNAYRLIENLFDDQDQAGFYFRYYDDKYQYKGPEETAEIKKLKNDLRKKMQSTSLLQS